VATETVAVSKGSVVPLLEKPTAEVKVRGLAHDGDVFVRSLERAEGLAVPGNDEAGYRAYSGAFVGLRREVRGPLYLGPSEALVDGRAATTEALCAAIAVSARPNACAHVLRRLAFPDGATLGFRTCLAGPCPVVFASSGSTPELVPSFIEGLTQLHGLWTNVAGRRAFRLVLERSVEQVGQGPRILYELAEVDSRGALTSVLAVPGSVTTIAPGSGEMRAVLVNVKFGESSARRVGTERVAPDVSSAGVVKTLDETIAYPR
jgi:hypothetical protein